VQIEQIKKLIKVKQYSISKHAFIEAFKDGFSVKDILSTINTGEVIEEYKDRNRILVYAKLGKRQTHVVVDYSSRTWPWIVTVYEPDVTEWKSGKIRR